MSTSLKPRFCLTCIETTENHYWQLTTVAKTHSQSLTPAPRTEATRSTTFSPTPITCKSVAFYASCVFCLFIFISVFLVGFLCVSGFLIVFSWVFLVFRHACFRCFPLFVRVSSFCFCFASGLLLVYSCDIRFYIVVLCRFCSSLIIAYPLSCKSFVFHPCSRSSSGPLLPLSIKPPLWVTGTLRCLSLWGTQPCRCRRLSRSKRDSDPYPSPGRSPQSIRFQTLKSCLPPL